MYLPSLFKVSSYYEFDKKDIPPIDFGRLALARVSHLNVKSQRVDQNKREFQVNMRKYQKEVLPVHFVMKLAIIQDHVQKDQPLNK